MSFSFSFKAGKTESFSLGRGKGVKEEKDTKTTMGFAEAEQTHRAVSTASDISWTYSLDLVDSLKLAGSFPRQGFKNVFLCVGWKIKWWLKEKLWQCHCEDEGLVHKLKKGQSWQNAEGVGVIHIAALPGSVWKMCELGGLLDEIWVELVPIMGSFSQLHGITLQTRSLKRPSRPPTDLGYSANKLECSFVGQSQLQRLFFEKKKKKVKTGSLSSHSWASNHTYTHINYIDFVLLLFFLVISLPLLLFVLHSSLSHAFFPTLLDFKSLTVFPAFIGLHFSSSVFHPISRFSLFIIDCLN